ncbi:MAG: InlB B-repeat-containing protein, partial [Treponema sp.]|nr:InlB B-repeat-containing protein [Treponema sp.]
MKQNILWFMFIFVPCCLSSCEFENPFLEQLLYTVTFDVDGGEPGTSTATCPPGENVALPTSNPTKKDYVFGGWYT